MAQARGAMIRVLHQFEPAFRAPGAAAAFVMPHTTYGVDRAPNRQQNPTANQSPLRNKSDMGDPTVAGPITSILELRSIGRWLKGLLGAPVTGKAVTKQPTHVTGVTIHHASADCATGNGTLAYTHTGTLLAWAENGGEAGVGVDVTPGGNFTLESDGGGKSIRVTVVASELPGENKTDADIAVSTTLKAHVFPVNMAARPSALLEAQSADISKFYRTLGCMVNTLGWNVLDNDQNISVGIIAAYEVDPVPGSAFDANPTPYVPVRACSGKGRIYDGSTGLGTVVGGNIEFNNNMTALACADGQEGAGLIDNGELAIGGSIRAVFDGQGAYDKARNGASTRMRLETAGLEGANEFRVVVDGLYAELTESAPAKEGKSGLFADLAWSLHDGPFLPEIYLVNDVTSY